MKRGKTMKKLTKTFIAVAAVSTVSAVMAASAMAMTATYADGYVTLSGIEATGTSQTLLILTEDTNVTSDNANTIVKQIDQKDNDGTFEAVSIPVGTVEDGTTLYIRVSGTNGNLQTAEYTVGGGSEPETITLIVGDADMSGRVAVKDASSIAKKLVSIDDADTQYINTEIEVLKK